MGRYFILWDKFFFDFSFPFFFCLPGLGVVLLKPHMMSLVLVLLLCTFFTFWLIRFCVIFGTG